MAYFMIGGTTAKDMKTGQVRLVNDQLEEQHWALVANHPEFRDDVQILREEKEMAFPDHLFGELWVAVLDDPEFFWPPLHEYSQKWGVPAALLAAIAESLLELDEIDPAVIRSYRRSSNSPVVTETEAEIVIRIPRPVTTAKQQEIKEYLRWVSTGSPREVLWGQAGRVREDPSPVLVEAVPWFVRWNDQGHEPAEIWRDLTDPHGPGPRQNLTFDQVHNRIVRVWERMRVLSPTGVREDRPSKRCA